MGKKWTLEVLLIEFRNQTVSIFFIDRSAKTFFFLFTIEIEFENIFISKLYVLDSSGVMYSINNI